MQLPKDFINNTRETIGEEKLEKLINALNDKPSVSIRLNPAKVNENVNLQTDHQQIIPWTQQGRYLEERPAFTFDPLFHAGSYYVQEASSMLLEFVFKHLMHENNNIVCLDLCAAPGGKSTLLLSLLSKNSFLVSNEYIRSRANILKENLAKWGQVNYLVTNNKPDDFEKTKCRFDFILVDAPCSGEGMFRKDIQAVEHWSNDNIALCVSRQKDIIDSAWKVLKPGGYLFYSTCTFNKHENEEVIEYICQNYEASVQIIPLNQEWGITNVSIQDGEGYHCYPGEMRGEGFFFAVVQKLEDKDNLINNKVKEKKINKKTNALVKELRIYLKQDEEYFITSFANNYFALPAKFESLFDTIKRELNILSVGVQLGLYKGKSFIPHQSLALSLELNESIFPKYEVTYLVALSFLRGENIVINDAPKGIVLIVYKGQNLGFVKNIGNRANNLYPSEWRIKSSRIPEKEVNVIG